MQYSTGNFFRKNGFFWTLRSITLKNHLNYSIEISKITLKKKYVSVNFTVFFKLKDGDNSEAFISLISMS